MTDLQFLKRQEALAAARVERALLGKEGLEGAVAAIERTAMERPLVSVGASAALGGLLGVALGRTSGRTLLGAARLARGPLARFMRAKI
jgi:hypothetical protein